MFESSPLGTILIVDDDPNITELLKRNLSSEGFGVEIISSAMDVDILSVANMRMVIVDSFNQDYTGLDLVHDIKCEPSCEHVPVIICASSDSEDMVITALDGGADDFISKPFSLREFLSRVKAVLRRHPMRPGADMAQLHQGLTVPELNLEIDTVGQKVVENGAVVPLTKTEYAILLFLIKNQNSFFTRNQICLEVWKDETGSNARIVDTNISRLRKKLGETGKHIINRYGQGYAFVEKLS